MLLYDLCYTTPVVDAGEAVLRLNPIWLPQANLHKSEKLKNQV